MSNKLNQPARFQKPYVPPQNVGCFIHIHDLSLVDDHDLRNANDLLSSLSILNLELFAAKQVIKHKELEKEWEEFFNWDKI